MKHLLLFSALFVVTRLQAQSGFSETIYDPSGGLQSHDITESYDHDFILVGENYSYGAIYKIDSLGGAVWSKTIANSKFYAIQPTADSAFIICGAGHTNSSTTAVVLKIDNNGTVLWAEEYPDASVATHIISTSDGGFAIAGDDHSTAAGRMVLIKTDATGNLLWEKRYAAGNNNNMASVIRETADSGFVIGGYTEDYPPYHGGSSLIRTDASGNIIWAKRYEKSSGTPSALRDMHVVNGRYLLYVNAGDRTDLLRVNDSGAVTLLKSYAAYSSNVIETRPSRMNKASGNTFLLQNGEEISGYDGSFFRIDTSGNILSEGRFFFYGRCAIEAENGNIVGMGNGPILGVSQPGTISQPQTGIYRLDSTSGPSACFNPQSTSLLTDSLITVNLACTTTGAGTQAAYTATVTSVALTVANECVTFFGSVAEKQDEINISVSPNPAIAVAAVDFDKSRTEMTIRITDISGKLIHTEKIPAGSSHLALDLTAFRSGIYTIELSSNNKAGHQKLVVTRHN